MTTQFPRAKDSNISQIHSKNTGKALASHLFLLQQLGPLAFIIREDGTTKSNQDKKYRISLGPIHQCTCTYNVSRMELCHHILWVMLKILKVPSDSPLLYKTILNDREITDLMSYRQAIIKDTLTKQMEKQEIVAAVQQRPIEEEDVCPVCQEGLFDQTLPLLYCQSGCGNNVHVYYNSSKLSLTGNA